MSEKAALFVFRVFGFNDFLTLPTFITLTVSNLPRVSIITPFKNAAETIAETAQSILAQTHTNWEWILINDHSNQDESTALKNFLTDPRIRIFQNEGSGIVDALVTAEKQIRGEFLTRMDADDVMPHTKLELFLHALMTTSVQIVTGKVQYFSVDQPVSSGYRQYQDWLNARSEQQDFYTQIYRECPVASGNWCMRTSDHFSCGGFADLHYPEDYDLVFRWKKAGFQILGIDQLTHLWREHPLRTSRTSENYAQEAFFRLKIREFVSQEGKQLPIAVLGTGQKGRLTAKNLMEQGCEFVWISHEPEKFPQGIYGQQISSISALTHFSGAVLNTTLLDFHEMIVVLDSKPRQIQLFQL